MKRLNLLATLLLFAGTVSVSHAAVRPKITFWMYNYAYLGQGTLEKSESRVSMLFSGMGVDTVWVNCSLRQAEPWANDCKAGVGITEIAVRLLNRQMWRGLRVSAAVLGFAIPYYREQRLNIVYIDCDALRQLAMEGPASADQLVAAVIAHEVGHLLIGPHAHSLSGIMRAQWSRNELLLLASNRLTMLAEQAKRIRAELLVRAREANSSHAALQNFTASSPLLTAPPRRQ